MQLKVLKIVCERGLNVKKTEELVEKAIERLTRKKEAKPSDKKFTKSIKDVRIFINTVKQALELIRKAGVNARAAQFDRGDYLEFIIRLPKT